VGRPSRKKRVYYRRWGAFIAGCGQPVVDSKTGELIVDRNEEINEQIVAQIIPAGINRVQVRSP